MLVVVGQGVLKHKTKELKGSPTQPLTTGLNNSPFLKRGSPSMISFLNCFTRKEFRHFKTQHQTKIHLFAEHLFLSLTIDRYDKKEAINISRELPDQKVRLKANKK